MDLRKPPLSFAAATAILTLLYTVGIIGIAGFDSQTILSLTPLNLLITLAYLWFFTANPKPWGAFIFSIAFGFLIEWVGIQTGFPFGAYRYGTVLGYQWMSTPLMIGVNWAIISLSVNAVVARAFSSLIWRVLCAAVLMVLIDFLIEPDAIEYGMWHWEQGTPPWTNYAGWLATSLIISYGWQRTPDVLPRAAGLVVATLQVVFFTIL